MLEKPDLPDQFLIDHLSSLYGIHAGRVVFLPLGADVQTAVYRVEAAADYFVKLWRGGFNETPLQILHLLRGSGSDAVIAPLETRKGSLWSTLADYRLVVYPFVRGQNGYQQEVSDGQWIKLGAALKQIHAATLPESLARQVARESFSPRWRAEMLSFLGELDAPWADDRAAQQLIECIRSHKDQIAGLIARAESLAGQLTGQSVEFVLCHSDLHLGNILLAGQSLVYIVDWDSPIYAPVERDLMFAGGGTGHLCNDPASHALFYQGYGPVAINQPALAYYRYERIVEDMAAFSEQLLLTGAGGADREQSFQYFASNFLPGGTIESAYRADGLLE